MPSTTRDNGDAERERKQQPQQRRVPGQGHQRKGHGMQGVSRRKTVLVERRDPRLDATVGGERSRPTRPAFEPAVEQGGDAADHGHVGGGAQPAPAIAKRKDRHQRVPERAVPEPADDTEVGPHCLARAPPVRGQAPGLFERLDGERHAVDVGRVGFSDQLDVQAWLHARSLMRPCAAVVTGKLRSCERPPGRASSSRSRGCGRFPSGIRLRWPDPPGSADAPPASPSKG